MNVMSCRGKCKVGAATCAYSYDDTATNRYAKLRFFPDPMWSSIFKGCSPCFKSLNVSTARGEMKRTSRHYGAHTVVDVPAERDEAVAVTGSVGQLDGWLALLENVALRLCETIST